MRNCLQFLLRVSADTAFASAAAEHNMYRIALAVGTIGSHCPHPAVIRQITCSCKFILINYIGKNGFLFPQQRVQSNRPRWLRTRAKSPDGDSSVYGDVFVDSSSLFQRKCKSTNNIVSNHHIFQVEEFSFLHFHLLHHYNIRGIATHHALFLNSL